MRTRSDRKATAAVEFALVAPMLCGILLGTLEIGRALQVEAALTNAVREGCRGYAASSASLASGYTAGTAAYVQYLVTDSLSKANLNINTANVTVTAAQSSVTVSGLALTQVTVTATLPYSSISYFPPFILKGNLTATVGMNKSS